MSAARSLGLAALTLGVLAGPGVWVVRAERSAAATRVDATRPVERRAYLMGTRVALATRAVDRAQGLIRLEGLLASLESVEAELSTWREDSLLSRINRQPVGEPRPAPARLCGLLAELGEWRAATGGAFDPAVGRVVDAWDLRGAGRRPSARALWRARRDSGLALVALRRSPCRVTRTRDVLLDAGAFGKGAALDRAARDLAARGAPWMIDLGGQVAVGGSAEAPWPVALAHPRRRDEAALRLALAEGSLSTSGGSERDVRVGDTALGHVLDPRTGVPVSRAGSVTVWHRRALVADVLSTALYVMGPEAGLAWAEARGVAACFLEPRTDRPARVAVRASAAFRRRFGVADATPEARGEPAQPPASAVSRRDSAAPPAAAGRPARIRSASGPASAAQLLIATPR